MKRLFNGNPTATQPPTPDAPLILQWRAYWLRDAIFTAQGVRQEDGATLVDIALCLRNQAVLTTMHVPKRPSRRGFR